MKVDDIKVGEIYYRLNTQSLTIRKFKILKINDYRHDKKYPVMRIVVGDIESFSRSYLTVYDTEKTFFDTEQQATVEKDKLLKKKIKKKKEQICELGAQILKLEKQLS